MTEFEPPRRSLPPATLIAAYAAFAFFAVMTFWGAFSPHGEGHLGGGLVANVMVGENAFRWRQWYPSWLWFTEAAPPAAQWICSHPYGMLWVAGGTARAFGHSNFVAVMPAIVMSCLTPPILWSTVRKQLGEFGAACTAWGFVCLPLAIGFAKFQSLEVFVIFGCALFSWGHVRYLESGRYLHLMASIAGAAFASTGDWPGFIYLGAVLGWGFARRFLTPTTWSPRVNRERYARWWATTAVMTASMGLFTMILLYKGNRIECLLAQATRRSVHGSVHETLFQAFERRKTWVEASFTPLPLFLGKVACIVSVVRTLRYRRDEEVFALVALLLSYVQYMAFPQGADVHTFWPHYFALYFAFAFGQLGSTVHGLVTKAWSRFAPGTSLPRATQRVDAVALGILGIFLAVVMPDSLRCAFNWRSTGGNFASSGPMNRDQTLVLRRVVRPLVPRGDLLEVDSSLPFGAAQSWATQRDFRNSSSGPMQRDVPSPVWLGRPSALSGTNFVRFGSEALVQAYGDLWVVDRRHSAGPANAYSLGERAPSLLELWLFTETEPAYDIGTAPDPFLTWELRHHLEQTDLPPLPSDSSSLDELRILRNRAASMGATADVASFDQRILARLALHEDRSFAPGITLLGTRTDDFAVRMGEVWIRVDGPAAGERRLSVIAKVVARAQFSWITPDPQTLTFNVPLSIPSSLWKVGFVYRFRFPMRKRPGVERFSATMGASPVVVATF